MDLKQQLLKDHPDSLQLVGYGPYLRWLRPDDPDSPYRPDKPSYSPCWPLERVAHRTVEDFGCDDWEWLLRHNDRSGLGTSICRRQPMRTHDLAQITWLLVRSDFASLSSRSVACMCHPLSMSNLATHDMPSAGRSVKTTFPPRLRQVASANLKSAGSALSLRRVKRLTLRFWYSYTKHRSAVGGT